jgi:hypothetical protein
MNKTKTQRRTKTKHRPRRRHIGGYTSKNITGNANSKGLGIKTFHFNTKHNKKRWNQKH